MNPVKDNPSWYRDDRGNLVNTNANAYKSYLEKKKVAESKSAQINDLQDQINNLDYKLNTIISLLQSK